MAPSNPTSDDAAQMNAQAQDEGRSHRHFPPVALPALAAAVHVTASAARAARSKLAGRPGARIVHEDEPTL